MSDILYSDDFAYDVSNDILSKGEVFDYDCINQSIENILTTSFGERLFNPYFGSSLGNQLFEGMNNNFLNSSFIKKLIDEIYLWEDRITFDENRCSFTANPDDNSVILELTYMVDKTKIINTFKRKIRIYRHLHIHKIS